MPPTFSSAVPVFLATVLSLLAQDAPAPARAAADDRPFAVSVLRRDGYVLPFATYDGKRWSSRWPVEIRFVDLPISLASVPSDWWGKAEPPASMTHWADGASRGPVTLGAPVPIPIACDRRLTLKSNYVTKDAVPVRIVQPYPKDGLLISTAHPVERIQTVERGSADWQATIALMFEEFNKAEDRAARAFTSWQHPVAPRDRRRLPMEVEAMYRAPMDEGGTAYFVEAVRRFPARPEDEGCGLVTLVSGWVLVGPKKPEFELEGLVSFCDRRGAFYMLPLGLIRGDNRAYWIYQLSGYGSEIYRISRPYPKGVTHEISYSAAWCPNF